MPAAAREDSAYISTVVSKLTGGINTKTPPTDISGDQSPDLENVAFHSEAVDRRGGFPPFVRTLPRLNSIVNVGRHTRAAENDGSFTDVDYLDVAGLMLAGNRQVQNLITEEYTIEFFLRIDDLTDVHGGNGTTDAALYPGGPAPYVLKVRPIFFKGPAKKTANQSNPGPTASLTHMRWATTAQPRWGLNTASYALPYGIYLYNESNTPGSPIWRFKFALHERSGGLWTIRIVTSTATPEVGVVYHVIASASFSNEIMTLRIGKLDEPLEDPSYVTDTAALTAGASAAITTGPIQVFDCPQEFIDSPSPPHATRPPGLDLVGGYWFASKRFEGAIEDIAMHVGDLIGQTPTALDRRTKYDSCDLPASVRQFWSMTEPGGYVEEMVGYGNHLFLAPDGPVYDPIDGSPRPTGSWWFNGMTSYVLADLVDNPNWRYMDSGVASGAWQTAVRNNMPHGLEITVWPDAIDPLFEQVLIEAHSALRIAIEKDGTVVGYARDGSSNVPGVTVPQYQATRVQSTFVLQEGTRYTIALLRTRTTVDGDTLQLYINGRLDAQVTTLTPADQDGQPISGLTVGMGSYEFTTYTSDTTTPVNPTAGLTGDMDEINTDARSGFIGRVESFRVLAGSATAYATYRDDVVDDYRYAQNRLWESPRLPVVLRDEIVPDDPNDLVQNVGHGSAAAPSGDTQQGRWLRYVIEPTNAAPAPFNYMLPQAPPHSHSLRISTAGGMDVFSREVSIYHTLGRWVLNYDDRDVGDCGRHHPKVEIQIDSGAAARRTNFFKGTWIQQSQITEELNVFGSLQKRSTEQDWMSDDAAEYVIRRYSNRLRPHWYASPTELRPQWRQGIAYPRAGQVETALIADWENERTGERFVITAAGRQLYWARPPWRKASPFCGDPSNTRVAWSHGSPGSRLEIPGSSSNQELSGSNNPAMEFRVYPHRLDGTVLLAFKGDPETGRCNFAVWLQDGVLNVLGTMSATTAWRYTGTVNQTHLRAGAWNYVGIVLGASSVTATVNGEGAPLTADAAFDAYAPGSADQSNYTLYLLGLPAQLASLIITHNAGASATTFVMGSLRGYLTEFRLRNVAPASIGSVISVPAGRFEDDANTWYLLHLTEGEGWVVTESAANSAGNDGKVLLDDMVLVHEGLEETAGGGRYNFVVFRNELLITNGRSNPHRIAFRRFSYPGNVFRVRRLGIQQPAALIELEVSKVVGAGTTTPAGDYAFWITFADEEGVESEPAFLGTYSPPAGVFDSLSILGLPRSPDPQVTQRFLYMTPGVGGGGIPVLARVLPDNISRDVDLVPPSGGLAVEANGRKLPAPRGKHIAVAQGSVWIANLPDFDAGQNSFRLSDGFGISWWPGSKVQAIDSEDGKPITAVRGHLGRVFLFKRDSIWQVSLVGNSIPVPSNVNASIGLGGAVVNYDNMLYGAGDKGIHLFSGADVGYMSMALEGDYFSLLDLSDEGLEQFFGSYFWPDSQYWFSAREQGRGSNRLIYVMQTDNQTAISGRTQYPWVRLRVPDHTYLETVLDPATRDPVVLIGTTSGAILRYDRDVTVDAATTDGTLVGTATATSSTSLTMAGAAFDTTGYGLKGARVTITDGANTYERTIESNTATTVSWIEPIAGLAQTPTFTVGGYTSYWSPAWVAPQKFGSFLQAAFVDFQFAPNPASLIVRTIAAIGSTPTDRAFPVAAADQHAVVMTNGWVEQPTRVRSTRGRYFRMRFENSTPGDKFSVSAWQLRWQGTGQRGGRSR